MFKRVFLSIFLLIPTLSLRAVDIPTIAPGLGKVSIELANGAYHVLRNGVKTAVSSDCVDKTIRNFKPEQLHEFAKYAYLRVKQYSDGAYKIEAMGRLNGGGPVLAAAFYSVTKGICWSVVGTGLSFGVKKLFSKSNRQVQSVAGSATGKIINRASGLSNDISSIQKTTALVIKNTGNEQVAGDIAAGVVSVAGAGGVASFIESISMAAYAAGMAIPWW